MAQNIIQTTGELVDAIDGIIAEATPQELWYFYLYMKNFRKGKNNE